MFGFLLNKITKERILEAILENDNNFLNLNNINVCFNDKILVNKKQNKCLFNYLRNNFDEILKNKDSNDYKRIIFSEIMFFNNEFESIFLKHHKNLEDIEKLLVLNPHNEALVKIKEQYFLPKIDENYNINYNLNGYLLAKKHMNDNTLKQIQQEYLIKLFKIVNKMSKQKETILFILKEEINLIYNEIYNSSELNFLLDKELILNVIGSLEKRDNIDYLLFSKLINNEYKSYLLIKNRFGSQQKHIELFRNFLPNYSKLIDIKIQLFINNYGKLYFPLEKFNKVSNLLDTIKLMEESEYKNKLINKIKDELHIFDDNINLMDYSLSYQYFFIDIDEINFNDLSNYGVLESYIYDCFNI